MREYGATERACTAWSRPTTRCVPSNAVSWPSRVADCADTAVALVAALLDPTARHATNTARCEESRATVSAIAAPISAAMFTLTRRRSSREACAEKSAIGSVPERSVRLLGLERPLEFDHNVALPRKAPPRATNLHHLQRATGCDRLQFSHQRTQREVSPYTRIVKTSRGHVG